MNDRPRILVVDDEPQLTRVLRTGLSSRGYEVRAAADGLSAFDTFNDWQPDLVITDLGMPNMNGLELCRRLRAISQVPIIVLSAKGEEQTKVEALDTGADDFVTKPFGIDELLARVRASLRRAATPLANQAALTVIEAGDFHVDFESRKLRVLGREIHLTPKEFDLLTYLFSTLEKYLLIVLCCQQCGEAITLNRMNIFECSWAICERRLSQTQQPRATSSPNPG